MKTEDGFVGIKIGINNFKINRMRTEREILDKMQEIENSRKNALKYYIASKSDKERDIIAGQNMSCLEQINLLKWVLNQ